jgi:nucleotide-binding universal stress UspA family protein
MKIMMYYDGTEKTKQTLPLVKNRAKALHARVDVVSSMPRGGEAQLKEIEKREDELISIKHSLEKQDIPCDIHLLIKGNDAGDDIASYAKKNQVDEIIIGTNKKSLLEQFFTGLMARHVISNTQCPVLIAG